MAKSKIVTKIQNAELTEVATFHGWTAQIKNPNFGQPNEPELIDNPKSSIQYGLDFLANKFAKVLEHELMFPTKENVSPKQYVINSTVKLTEINSDITKEVVL